MNDMINKNELSRYMGAVRLQNLQQVETNYLQHIILSSLYSDKSGIGNYLVFKGGTALQMLSIVDRFSIDLDFTARSVIGEKELGMLVSAALKGLQNYGYNASYKICKDKDEENIGTDKSKCIKFSINGPIFLSNEDKRSISTVKLEISLREEPYLEAVPIRITPPYSDISPYMIVHMAQNEMLAEKMRALLTRKKARDLYDISALLSKKFIIELPIIRKKLLAVGKDSITAEEVLERAKSLKSEWNKEIRTLIFSDMKPPEFDEVIKLVESTLSQNAFMSFEFDMGSNKGAHAIHMGKGEIFPNPEFHILHYPTETANGNKANEGGFYTPFDGRLDLFSCSKSSHLYVMAEVDGNKIVTSMLLDLIYAYDNTGKGTMHFFPNNSFIEKHHNLTVKIFCEEGRKCNGTVAISGIFSKAGLK